MHQHGEVCRFAAARINTLKFAARLQEVAGTSRPRDWEVVFASASGARSTGGRGASAPTRWNGTLVDLLVEKCIVREVCGSKRSRRKSWVRVRQRSCGAAKASAWAAPQRPESFESISTRGVLRS